MLLQRATSDINVCPWYCHQKFRLYQSIVNTRLPVTIRDISYSLASIAQRIAIFFGGSGPVDDVLGGDLGEQWLVRCKKLWQHRIPNTCFYIKSQ